MEKEATLNNPIFPNNSRGSDIMHQYLAQIATLLKIPVTRLDVSTVIDGIETAGGLQTCGLVQMPPGPNTAEIYWNHIPHGISVAIQDLQRSYSGDDKLTIMMFYLSQFPGCCGVAVSHNAWVHSSLRHKGLNNLGMKLRMDLARAAGYSYLLMSDKESNQYSLLTMEKNGVAKLADFINRRTYNRVQIRGIKL